MKCPVCEKEIDGRKKQCSNCGFFDFRKEFLNQKECELWQKETVEPCKCVYIKMKNDLELEHQYVVATISEYSAFYDTLRHELFQLLGDEITDKICEYSLTFLNKAMSRMTTSNDNKVASVICEQEKEIFDLKNEQYHKECEIAKLKEKLAEYNEESIIESDPF